MSGTYLHQGWAVSPYSAKTRTYLRYKQIPHRDHVPNAFELLARVGKKVGRPIMPTVVTPDGDWWQDSSEIIDAFEARFPEHPVVPETPRQRLAAYLFEFHGDEWLVMPALYYRWTIPANHDFAINEFGRSALPFAPGFLRRQAAARFARPMQGYLSVLGLNDTTGPGVEAYTTTLIAQLNTHLAAHRFLFGSRPSIGDFALFGPLWAHLYRDVGSTYLFDDAPAVVAWMDRLLSPAGDPGEFLADDVVPTTLVPLLRTLFAEQWAFFERVVTHVDDWCSANPEATRAPRAFGTAPFAIGGHHGERRLITFMYWMAQRPMGALDAWRANDDAAARTWLAEVGGERMLDTQLKHPMVRRDYKEVLAQPPGR